MQLNYTPLTFEIDKFELSRIVMSNENKCYLFGYLSRKKDELYQPLMLLCWQDILNEILVNMKEKKGKLLEKVVEEIQNCQGEDLINIHIEELFNEETLTVKNLIITATELEDQEDDTVVRGFIQQIIVKKGGK